MRAFGRVVPWLLLLVAIADWIGLKAGRLRHTPEVLGLLVGGTVLLLFLRLLAMARGVWSTRQRRGSLLGESLLVIGVLTALLAGSANWLLGLQGFVVLHEGEAVPLHGGSHLQQFDGGPLARIEEMDVVLALEEVEMIPAGPGLFYPRSRLVVRRRGRDSIDLAVDRETAGSAGPLRFFQGAFGFAPQIVILKDGEPLFDRVVPFTTERRGRAGITFEGRFTIETERLEVDGGVDLASLDEGMRGHATLRLSVRREGEMLGRGNLLPGHFADLAQGYRVGFTSLRKWSEVDVSRRHYGRIVLAGSALACLGAVVWPLAAWRRR